jgi:hypothetical protein
MEMPPNHNREKSKHGTPMDIEGAPLLQSKIG